jgi:hypothetical protein
MIQIMFRTSMPRVFELVDLIEVPLAQSAYFHDFETRLGDSRGRATTWLAREREFQRLDPDSWQALKSEARPRLTRPDPKRGWQQLIDILNQARAYNYLVELGCSGVRFVPRGRKKTPDLEGTLDTRKVLCEVKTINISEQEAKRRNEGQGGYTSIYLDEQFLKKVTSALGTAKSQVESYDVGGNSMRIVFLIINFDDSFAEYKADYYSQIDKYLASEPVQGIGIVFYNQQTAFHLDVSMRSALVVNEASWPEPGSE